MDLDYQDFAVCPHCGHKHKDCFEWRPDCSDQECQECGKRFFYNRDIAITYSTSKKEL